MFDIGFPELMLILVIALLVFGPGKMAEIGRELGKGVRDFRRATSDVTKEFNDALKVDEPAKPAPTPASTYIPPVATPAPQPVAVESVAVTPTADTELASPPVAAEPPQSGVVADEPGAS